jgi:hypothetical protein
MSFVLTLTSCRIRDIAKPAAIDDDENEKEEKDDHENDEGEPEDDEEESPYAGVSMSDEEKEAVLHLLRDAWSRHGDDGWSWFRLETPDGPVTIQAAGLSLPQKFPMLKVKPRALTARVADLLFDLMRDGNLYLRFDRDLSTAVLVSEDQRRHLTGHIRILEVCATPEELLHYLEGKRDARLCVDPDAFNESWEDLAEDAEAASRILVRDRRAGEMEFQRLMARQPSNVSVRSRHVSGFRPAWCVGCSQTQAR